MSDNAKPFTENERKAVLRYVGSLALNHPDRAMGYAQDSLRWDATLRQVEAALAEMTRERDALRHESDKLKVELSEAQEKRDELQDEVWDLTCELENEEP